ncbi:MAG TPA: ABC transporter substrate-binding protein [Flavisolibacter sp.]|jgi:ABC-type branched-subunit amino acid transport system substrate-binding protein|nr:ABC transporter substrate-binding protein [Flavisolibacter sp.]
MKKYFSFFGSLLFLAMTAVGQPNRRHKIAVFAPLYLDSAFSYSGNYAFNKTFPRFLNAGVEFYQGIETALDSLQKKGAPLEVFVYDSRSATTQLAQQVMAPELDSVEMIIAHANPAETKLLADAALAKKIPFISATLPNDAGVTANPYFVVLNTTLQGHIEGIYKLLQRNHALDRVIVIRKPGQQEDAIKSHFSELARNTASVPVNIKFVDMGPAFSAQMLAAQMDSTKRNIIISGSMEEDFGTKLAGALAPLAKTYPTLLVGMPTWDNVNFNKAAYKGLDIVYSAPFFYNRLTPLESKLAAEFEKTINGKPTDMYFRGYETMMRFALLLLDTNKDVASNLTRKGNAIFTKFDIQPVFKDKKNMTLDYFENKNLYFIRVSGGAKRLM